MPIQFFCVACRQPIEVDDIMANQAVTCPYCRKVVTAPAATEGAMLDNPPLASPSSETSGTTGAQHFVPGPPPGKNILSWVSLISIAIAVVMLAIVLAVQMSIYKGLPPNTTPQEASKLVNEELQKRPGMWVLSTVGSCLAPLVAVICGIIALVRRTPPRWPAVTALVICGILVVIVCMGFAFLMANAGGKPAA